jgi:hypothetical protein
MTSGERLMAANKNPPPGVMFGGGFSYDHSWRPKPRLLLIRSRLQQTYGARFRRSEPTSA